MADKKPRKTKRTQALIGGNVEHSNIIIGDHNKLEIHHHGKQIVIPSAEDVTYHRAALKERLEKEAQERWGGMFFYIQEEGATLPIEASPYETGKLGARTNLQDSLKSAERMLLLGDPGSGKTVALERLAWELSAEGEPTLPVVIRLFRYDGKSLSEWVRSRLRECGCLRLDDEDTLTVFLQEGTARCVFLFDGLNEIPPVHRNALVGELDRWISANPRHAVIITSRVQDELWRKLRRELPAMVVQPIHNKQVCEYLIVHLGKTKGEELYHRLDERLLGLTSTPLVLWLIKEAGVAGESLPNNRGELYQRFVKRMLRRDLDREIEIQFSERMKEQALCTLALHINREQRLTCSRREAVDVIAGAFEKDTPDKLDKADALVKACARHGLLAGEDELWFAPHQTVQEHFAAVALKETVEQEQKMSNTARLLHTLTGKRSELNALSSEDWWMETLVQLAGIFEDPNWLARTIAQTNPLLAWHCMLEGREVDDATYAWVFHAGAVHTDSNIRTSTIRNGYRLWKRNPKLGFKLLDSISKDAFFGIIPNTRAFESFVIFSLIIFLDHFKDEKILQELQIIWRRNNLAKFFIVDESAGNFRRILPNFTRAFLSLAIKIIFRFLAIDSIFRLLKDAPQYAHVVRYRDLVIFFHLGDQEKKLYKDLVGYLNVNGGYSTEQMERDFSAAIKIQNLLFQVVVLLGLIVHTQYDPDRFLPFLKKFFEAALDDAEANIWVGTIPVVLMSVLDRNPKRNEYFDFFVYTVEKCQEFYKKKKHYETDTPEAQYLGIYILYQYLRTENLETDWLKTRIDAALSTNNIGFFKALVNSELVIVGIERRLPLAALQTLALFFDRSNAEIRHVIQIFLMRLRMYYPDEVEDFLEKQHAPEDFCLSVSTSKSVQTVSALIEATKIWEFIQDVFSESTWLQQHLTHIFAMATDFKDAKTWLTYVLQYLINLVYGKKNNE